MKLSNNISNHSSVRKKLKGFLKKRKILKKTIIGTGGLFLVLLILFSFGLYLKNYYKNRVLPGVKTFDISLGNKKQAEAEELLTAKLAELEKKEISLVDGANKARTNLGNVGVEPEPREMAKRAMAEGRKNHWATNILVVLKNLFFGTEISPYFVLKEETLNKFIREQFGAVVYDPTSASIVYRDGQFKASSSREGKGINLDAFAGEVKSFLENPQQDSFLIDISSKITKQPLLDGAEVTQAAEEANFLINNSPNLWAGDKRWQIDKEDIFDFIVFKKDVENEVPKTALADYLLIPPSAESAVDIDYTVKVEFSRDKIKEYLTTIAPGVEQPAINAVVGFEEGKLVIKVPSRHKISLDIEKSVELLASGFKNKDQTIELEIVEEPALINEDSLKELGINELLAVGTSNFAGSPKNRRHNIQVGSSKFNGVLIASEETFSFLDHLGPVDASTGYLPELVIKNDKTIPEYGGGMCQVSTTAFRGAVNSGFEIVERRNHAYPVQYYAPQGTDATVYIPSPDLKFKNNTPAHVLIQTKIEGNILTFEYYGTSDGRRVETVGPVIYDRKPDGAMRANWTQKVFKLNGELWFEETFKSRYDSPNKYPHPGEEPPKEEKKKKKKH